MADNKPNDWHEVDDWQDAGDSPALAAHKAKVEQLDQPLSETPETILDPIDLIPGQAIIKGGKALGAGMRALPQIAGDAASGMMGGVGKLASWLGGGAAGLGKKEAQAYASSPRTVEALAKASPLRQQQFAESALESVSGRIGQEAGRVGEEMVEAVGSKQIPYSRVGQIEQQASSVGQPLIMDPATGTVTGENVLRAGQRIGEEGTKWTMDPVTGQIMRATDPAMGEAYGVAKQALIEAEPAMAGLKQQAQGLVEAQKGIRAGQKHPSAFMSSGSADIAAAKEAADIAAGSTRLQRTSGQMRAAKRLDKPASGVGDKILKTLGKGALRGGKAAEKAAAKIDRAVDKAVENKVSRALTDIVGTGVATKMASGLGRPTNLESFLKPKKKR